MTTDQKNIFVTGGTGLLGSHLLFALASRGEKPVAIFRNESKINHVSKVFGYYSHEPEKLFSSIQWVKADMSDAASLGSILSGADHVYHCAAEVSFDPSEKDRVIANNYSITENLVNACLINRIKKVCHVSSIAALGGARDNKPITEEQVWDESRKHSAYAISKHLSEDLIWKAVKNGLNAVIVNPSVILGPGEWGSGSSAYFSRIRRGMPFFTSGVTGYVDVRDVAESMILLMISDISGERYIVSSENVSFEILFSTIARNLGVKAPFLYMPESLALPATRIIKVLSGITGKKPAITTDNIKSAYALQYYENSKVVRDTGIIFKSVRKSVEETCRIYLAELKGK